jgi:hypothetical protein
MFLPNKHILLYRDIIGPNEEFEFIKTNFCGKVLTELDNVESETIVYACGNIQNITLTNYHQVYIIKELSYNYDNTHTLINIGYVPINVHNVGVHFRNFFQDKNYFDLISTQHKFQELTESNKITNAFRTGIYLTKVEEVNDEIKFKLLRCSSNLNGPTDNFRDIDNDIIEQLNDLSKHFFDQPHDLNHVLAQIYENKISDDNKQKKAKIKAHSDKTKDMPPNGLIAFCTFYKDYCNGTFTYGKYTKKMYDYCYKDTSVLTKLRFKLKKCVIDASLQQQFEVTLYPGSIFIISLLTNRLYTHEIVPSMLPVDKIPTRLGYVIRCSNTEAVFKGGQTFINKDNNLFKLEEPTETGIQELKDLYFKENVSSNIISYGNFVFSVNKGDYEKPII